MTVKHFDRRCKRPTLTMAQLRFINLAISEYITNHPTVINLNMASRVATAIGVVPPLEICITLESGIVKHSPDCDHDISEDEAEEMLNVLGEDDCGTIG